MGRISDLFMAVVAVRARQGRVGEVLCVLSGLCGSWRGATREGNGRKFSVGEGKGLIYHCGGLEW